MAIVTYNYPLTGEMLEATVGPTSDDYAMTTVLKLVESEGRWTLKRDSLNPTFNGKTNLTHFLSRLKEVHTDDSAKFVSALQDITAISWKKVKDSEKTQEATDPFPKWARDIFRKYIAIVPLDEAGEHILAVRRMDPTKTLEENLAISSWNRVSVLSLVLSRSKFLYTDDEGGLKKRSLLRQIELELIEARSEAETNKTWGFGLSCMDIWRKYRLEERLQELNSFIKELVSFTNDPQVPAYQYFPLNNLPELDETKCWAWTNFDSQMPEWARPVWRSVVYGIYDAGNKTKQICFLQDGGTTGKTPIFNALKAIGGKTFGSSLTHQGLESNFYGAMVYGKRLLTIAETNHTKLTLTGKVKALSGGETIAVEFKGETPFEYTPNVRILVSSNYRPEVDMSQDHQSDRVLFIPLTRIDYGKSNTYQQDLEDQFLPYLALCRIHYDELCPTRGEITLPPEMIEELKQTCTSESARRVDAIASCISVRGSGRLSDRCLKGIIDYMGIKDKGNFRLLEQIRRDVQLRWNTRDLGHLDDTNGISDWHYGGIELAPHLAYSPYTGQVTKVKTAPPVETEEEDAL